MIKMLRYLKGLVPQASLVDCLEEFRDWVYYERLKSFKFEGAKKVEEQMKYPSLEVAVSKHVAMPQIRLLNLEEYHRYYPIPWNEPTDFLSIVHSEI